MNDVELRMTTVTSMLQKELQIMLDQKEKRERTAKSLKDVFRGPVQEVDEIKDLESKLDSLEIPEEARKIYR